MTSRSARIRPSGGALLWSLAAVGIIVVWGGLWWYVKYGTLDDEPADRPRRLKVKASERGEGVYVHRKGVIRIVAGDVEFHLTPRPNSTLDIYAFAPQAEDWLTPQQDDLRKIGRKMTVAGKFVETLKITPEQMARARQLKLETDLILSDADRALLTQHFEKWQQSSGEAHAQAERDLFTTAKSVAERAIGATKNALFNDIEQVRAILTPEQWKHHDELIAPRHR